MWGNRYSKPHGFKTTEKIREVNQAICRQLGELMGDRVLPKLALNIKLVEGGLARSKASAYIKIKEYLIKGFIIEPYKLHYEYNRGWNDGSS